MPKFAFTRRVGDRAGTLNGMVDDLTLTYDGNRLVSVADAAPSSGMPESMDFADGAGTSFRNIKVKSGYYIQVDTFPDGKARAYGGLNKSAYTYKQWPASHWLIGVSLETNGHPLQIRFDEKNAKAFINDVNKQLR